MRFSAGETCEDELGRHYNDRETKTCPDGCNRCMCNQGHLAMTRIKCHPSEQLCKYGDQILKGDETVTCKDGRSKCTCKNGKIEISGERVFIPILLAKLTQKIS